MEPKFKYAQAVFINHVISDSSEVTVGEYKVIERELRNYRHPIKLDDGSWGREIRKTWYYHLLSKEGWRKIIHESQIYTSYEAALNAQ